MILTILQTVLGLVLLLGIGFLCSKVGLIDEAAEKKLTGLLLKVVQPMYLFMAYQRAFDRGLLRDFLICFAMAAAAFLVMILIPYLFFPKGSRDREVGLVVSAFPNTGFFGIPLIAGIYGTEGVFFLTTMITMFNVLVWTYGVIVMAGRRDSLKNTVKRLISPALIAVAGGLVCFWLGLLLPETIASPLRKLGDMNTPLASGFPVGSVPLMFSVQYDKNSVLAGECLALTALACAITTPLVYLLLNLLMGAI